MLWSEWTFLGLDNDLFWDSTLEEVEAVFDRAREADRKADRRAGLIAAQVTNMAGKVSRRTAKPDDFFRYDDAELHDTPEALRDALIGFAKRTGAKLA